jgi:hypothetical protein
MSDRDVPATSWAVWAWQAYRDGRLVEADRIEELEAERDSATVALMHLERCAQVVSERGAVTGPQWTRLSIAILKARSVLSKLPNPAPSNERRLVRSEATLAELKGDTP